jgi:hypothetical protein
MTEKRVGIVGSYQQVNSANMKTSEVVKKTTKNLGNMMFRYAVCRDVGEFRRIDTKMDPAKVREEVDVLVLPMANNVNPFFDMGYMARFLESCNLPTLAVGLGAQATLESREVKQLPEGSIRFLKVISDLSHGIGVRGEFTAEVLSRYGVNNTVVTGCPSNFICPIEELGAHLEYQQSKINEIKPSRVAVYSQLGNKNFHEPNITTDRLLFELARNNGYFYLHNFPVELIDYSRGGHETSLQWRKQCGKYLTQSDEFEQFDSDFRRMSHAFLSVESWMEFSSTCDLSVGKRVHGCLNTIQAGTFGVLIYHDERTRELVNTIGLPHISVNEISPHDDIQSILEKVNFSGSDYDQKRRDLYSDYRALFQQTGIENSNTLELSKPVSAGQHTPAAVAC